MNKDFSGLTCIGEVCSNFDGIVNQNIAQKLKQDAKSYAEYPCWHCFCKVWFDEETKKFGCQVKQYRCVVEEFYEETVEDIKYYVSSNYSAD